MTTPSRSTAPAGATPEGRPDDARLHIHDIREMPAGHDDEVAVIFREMRGATGMSMEQLSDELGTSPQVIAAMEAGDILALPEWTETARIMTAYAIKLGLDSRPMLRRLKAQLPEPGNPPPQPVTAMPAASSPPSPAQAPQRAPELQSPPRPDVPQSAVPPPSAMPPSSAVRGPPLPPGATAGRPAVPGQSPAPPLAPSAKFPPAQKQGAAPLGDGLVKEAKRKPVKRRIGFSAGTIVTWILLLGLFAGMGFTVRYASKHPGLVWQNVDKLPQPAPRMIRSLWELVRPANNTRPIEAPAGSSRSQKTDRL